MSRNSIFPSKARSFYDEAKDKAIKHDDSGQVFTEISCPGGPMTSDWAVRDKFHIASLYLVLSVVASIIVVFACFHVRFGRCLWEERREMTVLIGLYFPLVFPSVTILQ